MDATIGLIAFIIGILLLATIKMMRIINKPKEDDFHLGEITSRDIPRNLIRKEKKYAKWLIKKAEDKKRLIKKGDYYVQKRN